MFKAVDQKVLRLTISAPFKLNLIQSPQKKRQMLVREQLYSDLAGAMKDQPLPTASVRKFLQQYVPVAQVPAIHLHTLTLPQVKSMHGQTVLVRMMVQDILETEYYAGAMVSRTFDPSAPLNKQVLINKYWPADSNAFDEDLYEPLLMDRQVYHLVPIKGQSPWVKEFKQDKGQIKSALLRVFSGSLKLGEVVNAIVVIDYPDSPESDLNNIEPENPLHYYPIEKVPRLNMIRVLSKQEVAANKVDIEEVLLSKEINLQKSREQLLKAFQDFSSERYSQFLLYTLLARDNTRAFISGENLFPLIENLLPYTLEVSLKLPIQEKLFPYKENIIHETLLQLSDRSTFIVLDFTNLGAGTIKDQEIITLKQLKMLVEEGQIMYKWEFGESLFSANCSGIIAKASSIIKPTFSLKDEKFQLELIPKFSEAQSFKFRVYLNKCRSLLSQMQILEEDSKKIQEDFVEERKQSLVSGQISADTLNLRLIVAKLHSASHGQNRITYQAYVRAKELVKKLG